LNPFSKSQRQRVFLSRTADKQVRANSYDISQDGDTTKYMWAQANLFPADAAARTNIRAMIRKRSRYTYINNGYYRGMVDTKARDTIGRGPRLQFVSIDKDINKRLERDWNRWQRETNLNIKLRLAVLSRIRDGEVFGLFFTNPILKAVKLDIQLIEADRIASISGGNTIDGITFDDVGNPISYTILKRYLSGSGLMSNFDINPHTDIKQPTPGSMTNNTLQGDFREVPAEDVIHYYHPDRPGQHRGVAEASSSLTDFEILRRYTQANLIAAERAACFGIVLETENAVDTSLETDPVATDPYSEVELSPGTISQLPAGSKAHDFKAEHPSTTYPEFKKEILEECARPLGISFNVASGNSSGYNYASGRLDHQTYFKVIDIDRQEIAYNILDRVFSKWFAEWILLPENFDIDKALKSVEPETHEWYWDGHEHVDPVKEATADNIRIKNGTLPIPEYYASRGYDWRDKLAERLEYEVEEKTQREALGLPQTIPSTEQILPDANTNQDGEPVDNSEPVDTAPAMGDE